MRILLTGATGFVGENLLRALLATDHTIYVLTRSPEKMNDILGKENIQDVELIDLSATDWKTTVREANPDIAIHLAAYSTSADDEDAISRVEYPRSCRRCSIAAHFDPPSQSPTSGYQD